MEILRNYIPAEQLSIETRLNAEQRERLSPETLTCIEAVLAGARAIRETNIKDVDIKKGAQNFVTSADYASDAAIKRVIGKSFPNDAILSEEDDDALGDPLSVARLWVIDPLDGTSNARDAYEPNWAIAAGMAKKGKPFAGAVFLPEHGNMLMWGEIGLGTFVNGDRVAVTDAANVSEGFVMSDRGYTLETTRRNLEIFLKLQAPYIATRGCSVLGIANVARGRADLFFFAKNIKPWDNLAAMTCVLAAGGIAKRFDGQDATFMDDNIIYGGRNAVRSALEMINKK